MNGWANRGDEGLAKLEEDWANSDEGMGNRDDWANREWGGMSQMGRRISQQG